MIVLRKKQLFSLMDALYVDFGLSVSAGVDGMPLSPDIQALRSLGIKHVVCITKPQVGSNVERTKLSSTNEIITEAITSYWLDVAFEEFVQRHPLAAYREKYVLLTLKEEGSVRTLKGPLFEIRARGYEPIILHHSPQSITLRRPAIQYLCDLGCLFQLDLMTLTGVYGARAKTRAESSLSDGIFSVLTTGIRDTKDAFQLKNLMLSPAIISALEETIDKHKRLTYNLTA